MPQPTKRNKIKGVKAWAIVHKDYTFFSLEKVHLKKKYVVDYINEYGLGDAFEPLKILIYPLPTKKRKG